MRYNKLIFILIIILLVFVSAFIVLDKIKAGAEHNVSQWAWSENIGWISMNSTDTGASVSYGVELDDGPGSPTYGQFSGYAWSENIGWISFDATDTVGCPIFPCEATINPITMEVSGWARVLSVKDKPLDQTGGWNGWIRSRDTNYKKISLENNTEMSVKKSVRSLISII